LSGDTRPCEGFVNVARDADLLVHDATFSEAERDRALETRHSTAREAGEVARAARARRLVLTHFSSRHDTNPGALHEEAQSAFDGEVLVAEDGLTLEVELEDGENAPAKTA
jgi:ribonuclease Z